MEECLLFKYQELNDPCFLSQDLLTCYKIIEKQCSGKGKDFSHYENGTITRRSMCLFAIMLPYFLTICLNTNVGTIVNVTDLSALAMISLISLS